MKTTKKLRFFNYEIQIKSKEDYKIIGSMRLKDAYNTAMQEMINTNSPIAWIWPATNQAKKLIRKNYSGDYVILNRNGNIEGKFT